MLVAFDDLDYGREAHDVLTNLCQFLQQNKRTRQGNGGTVPGVTGLAFRSRGEQLLASQGLQDFYRGCPGPSRAHMKSPLVVLSAVSALPSYHLGIRTT